MRSWVQKSASMQNRTSPLKFAHLAGKSEKGSISNLLTKGEADDGGARVGDERHALGDRAADEDVHVPVGVVLDVPVEPRAFDLMVRVVAGRREQQPAASAPSAVLWSSSPLATSRGGLRKHGIGQPGGADQCPPA